MAYYASSDLMVTVGRRNFFTLLIGSAACWARNQQGPTFAGGVSVVNILASVRDKHGHIVQDLRKDDFRLLEDGRPQKIRYFAKQSDLPLTVALLIDTSMSQEHVLSEERHATGQFLSSALRPQRDNQIIVTFDTAIRLLQDIQTLEVPRNRQTGTLLYDAVYSICYQRLSFKQGRKVIIILSDGVDYRSRATVDGAVGEALRADVVIYSILFSDATFYQNMNPTGPYSPRIGAAVLKGMASATGGRLSRSSKRPQHRSYV